MLLNCVIIWTLLHFVQNCILRNQLYQNSYNVQNQPNIIPLGLLFNGSSLQFSIINNNNTQGYKIYQSVDLLQTYDTLLNVSQVIASSQFPIITNAQVQIQIIFLTQTQSTYQLYMTTWQSSSINTKYQLLGNLTNQQNCNRVTHLNQNYIVILCNNQLASYNMTSNSIIYSQIIWPTFTINYYWLKAINEDTVYVSFSDGSSSFTSTSYVNTNGQFVKVNMTNYDGIVTGFDVYPDNAYFILRNSILSYVNKNTQINCNITFSSQSFLSTFSGLNKLGQAHFYIAVINQTLLTQFIFNADNSLFNQPFQQSLPIINLSQQPQLYNDQYYFVIQFGSYYEVFNGYENQQIGISPLYYQQIPQNSLILYITYSDQILIQTVNQASLNQVNQPILVFEKPRINIQQNFTYTIMATGTLSSKHNCYQHFIQKSISAEFNQVQQYQNCSKINVNLQNPQIKQVDVGYCALGPNITYQAGTFVNIEGLGIDTQIGQFVIQVDELELFFQELAIYQINEIYTFQSNPREFTYFTYLINPLNNKQYIQLIQFNDYQVEYQICDKWICQNTTVINLDYEVTMSQIGADISKKEDFVLLITNAATSYQLCIYQFQNLQQVDLQVLDVAEDLNIDPTFQIQQIMLSGPYLYIIIDNPNQLVIYDIYNFNLVEFDAPNLQPRKLEQNYASYGDNIFLDNTINLIIFEMVNGQFTIGAQIPYPTNAESVAIGLLQAGVYIALSSNTAQSYLYYYSRQLLFQSLINQEYVIQIPLYNAQFIQPMISSFSQQFFYIQMIMPDSSIQLCIFKSDYYLLYLTYYFKEQFNSISVIQVDTLQNYDLIGFQSAQEFTILQNYWQVSVILNSEFLVPGIQLLNDTQILLICSNNYLKDYAFSFPVSVSNEYYDISRKNESYPTVNQIEQNFTIMVDPLQYFQGSIINYNVKSRGKNNAFISQFIIDYYYDFEPTINSATYSQQRELIFAVNNQQAVQYALSTNQTLLMYEFNNNQYTNCPFIFVEYYQQQPISFCTNNTDTYAYLNGQQIFSIKSLTGTAMPNLFNGFYQNYILIMGFQQNSLPNCLIINTYYVTWVNQFTMNLIEKTENCVYQLFTFTLININTTPTNLKALQCAGWIGITDDISTFPFHYNCFNFSQPIQQVNVYTPKQLFIQSILSNSIQLIQISQIGSPVIYSNYSEITLLFGSQNNAYSFVVQIYENSIEIVDKLLIFQQFSNQKAIQTVSGYNSNGNLTVISMFLQKVGSQVFQTLCIYQPFSFDFTGKLRVIEFLFCRTLHYSLPYTQKYSPFLYYLINNLVLTNQHMLIISQQLQIKVHAFPHTESIIYLNASNFDSFQNLTINIIQIDLDRTYVGWIVFSLLVALSIAIIWGYQYIKKLRNINTDTENYIEL
ncbi:unnamed protein product [Paramecium pentaurelia]|uniref:Transmembrane protein n=1 Tax=Paramecium pentaurelia TaxID=43138 RepID=A0A8S1WEY6_9CILI|nr:unnamed protein product [Paramecium pentaurelia]